MSWKSARSLMASALVGAIGLSMSQQPAQGLCPPTWVEGFHAVPFDAPTSVVVFDDGTGPTLFAAARRNVWKLVGDVWQPFGDQFYANTQNTAGVPVVRALAVFDDGSGPKLYVGGTFIRNGLSGATQSLCANIAMWNGTQWVGIGTGSTDPSLVRVGLTGIVQTEWNGGLTGVWKMLPFDPDGPGPMIPRLAVAGAFELAGDDFTSACITSWTGSQWLPMSIAGAVAPVYELGVFDFDGPGPEGESLIASGEFQFVGNTPLTRRVARYDGTNWHPMFEETLPHETAWPISFVSLDRDGAGPLEPELLATSFAQVLRYNPEVGWEEFESFTTATSAANHRASALAVDRDVAGDVLYIAGELWNINGQQAESLAKWSAASGFASAGYPGVRAQPCTAHDSQLGNSSFKFAQMLDADGAGPNPPQVVFTGNFRSIAGKSASAIGTYTPATGSFGAPGRGNGTPYLNGGAGKPFVWDADGAGPGPRELYVFSTGPIGDSEIGLVHKWAGDGWERVGNGCGPGMVQFAPYFGNVTAAIDGGQERLFAVGPQDLPLMWVLRGQEWELISDPGAVGNVTVLSAVGFDPDGNGPLPRQLYIARRWTFDEVEYTTEIVRYDGTSWSIITNAFTPVDCDIQLRVVDSPTGEQLYMRGNFSQIAGNPRNFGALFNPATNAWDTFPGETQLTNARNFPVWATVQGDSRMYLIEGGLKSWDGSAWQAIPGVFRRSNNAVTNPTGIFPFGQGTDAGLLVSGVFATIEGLPAQNLAFFDGEAWTGLTPGLLGSASSSGVVFNDGSGDQVWFSSSSVLRAESCCTADFNGVGGVTVQDIFDFLAAWFAGAPAADINHAGGVTVQDIFDYLAAWFAGC